MINAVDGIAWQGWLPENPRINKILTPDSLATITTAGYLDLNDPAIFPNQIYETDIWIIEYDYNPDTLAQTLGIFVTSISAGVITLVPFTVGNSGTILPVVSGNFAMFYGTDGEIYDTGLKPSNAANVFVSTLAAGTYQINTLAVFADNNGSTKSANGNPVAFTTNTSNNAPTVSSLSLFYNFTAPTLAVGSALGVGGIYCAVTANSLTDSQLGGSKFSLALNGNTDSSSDAYGVQGTILIGTGTHMGNLSGVESVVGGTFTASLAPASMFSGSNVGAGTLGQAINLTGACSNLFNLTSIGPCVTFPGTATPANSTGTITIMVGGTQYSIFIY